MKAADVARGPVDSYRRIAAPIRLLSLGVLINKAGGFVPVFLAPILAVRDLTTARIGVALFVAAGFGMAGSWFGGALVARLGSRRMIVGSMAGSAIFTAALAPAGTYATTIAFAGLISLFNRAYSPAAATMVGRLSTPDERVKMYSFFQLCLNVGAAIGPAAAGYLITRSLTVLLLLDALTSACFAIVCLRLPADADLPAPEDRPAVGRRSGAVWRDGKYLFFCLVVALVIMVFRQSAGPLPLVLKDHHDSFEVLGYMFTGNAVAVILFQLPLSLGTRRLPLWTLLSGSALLIGGGYTVLLAGISLPLLILNVTMWTAGEIILCPVTMTVATAMSTPRAHGAYQGALALARGAGMTVGPAVGVFAYSAGGPVPWLGSGALGLVAAVLFFVFLRHLPKPEEPQPSTCG